MTVQGRNRRDIFGLFSQVYGAGAALAPLFVGVMMGVVGVQGMPVYMAAILCLLALYAVYQVRHVSVLATGENVHFEPMVQTSHEIVEMINQVTSDKSESGSWR